MTDEISYEVATMLLTEKLKPFIRHVLYTLIKASQDTPISLSEAANRMGIKRETLKKRCQRGKFPYKKVDGVYYISVIDVNLFINGGEDNLQSYNENFK